MVMTTLKTAVKGRRQENGVEGMRSIEDELSKKKSSSKFCLKRSVHKGKGVERTSLTKDELAKKK